MSGVAAIVPFRALDGGKQRLRPLLDAAQRATLTRRMLSDVVRALAASGVVTAVAIVTLDARVAAVLHPFDARAAIVLQPPGAPGLIGGLETGLAWARRQEMSELLIVSADLPLLTGRDLQQVVARDAAVVIAPDRHLTGTNALLLRLDSLPGEQPFRFRFGIASYARHVAEAERQGVEIAMALTTGTMFDLDTPDDWHALPGTVQDRLLEPDGHGIGQPRMPRENAQCL